MGLDLKPIIPREKITLNEFSSRIIAIDTYNTLYQFLTTIRGADGLQLTDHFGKITSHISGFFYRNINFLSFGIKPVYVFDGKPSSLKSIEITRRKELKKKANIKYEKAMQYNDINNMKKYAQQSTYIKEDMIADIKYILDLFGIPYIQASSEGEATAAHLTLTGQAFAVASQDFDSILFGAKKLLRNFTMSGKRKIPNQNRYMMVEPEMIKIDNVLSHCNITREELIDIGILIGTDFNPDGFQNIGPKTALKLIQKYSKLENIPEIDNNLKKINYNEIRKIFLTPDVTHVNQIKFNEIDYTSITQYMTKERGFSETRIKSALDRLKNAIKKKEESLEKWFT